MKSTFELDEEARRILIANDRGGYTVPTDGLYPYQWNWDSAFAAFGFASFDIDRAWLEFEWLFKGQWSNGMVPHILFHQVDPGYFPGPEIWGCGGQVPSSGISQPPVAASFMRKVFESDPVAGRRHLEVLFPRLMAWHGWFMDWRLDRGAVCVTHPWEAGRDNALDWDAAMAAMDPAGVGEYTRRDTSHVDASMRPTKYDYDRYIWLVQNGRRANWDEAEMLKTNPFRVADPTLTFTLLRANRDLKAMGRAIGADTARIDEWIGTLEEGAKTLWNPQIGAYDARDVHSGAFAGSLSNASFLCWFAGVDGEAMHPHLTRMLRDVPFAIPSLDPENPAFDSRRYWRGPTWAIMNALIGFGLEDAGLTEEADLLRQKTAALIAEHGFAEYFDPFDGTPAGGGSFTWTAAVWLGWASASAAPGVAGTGRRVAN